VLLLAVCAGDTTLAVTLNWASAKECHGSRTQGDAEACAGVGQRRKILHPLAREWILNDYSNCGFDQWLTGERSTFM